MRECASRIRKYVPTVDRKLPLVMAWHGRKLPMTIPILDVVETMQLFCCILRAPKLGDPQVSALAGIYRVVVTPEWAQIMPAVNLARC